MLRQRLMASLFIALLLLTANTAVTGTLTPTGAGQANNRKDQEVDVLDTSFGFPVRIAYTSSLESVTYRSLMAFLFIDDRYCSPDSLSTVFKGLAKRYPEWNFIEMEVYSDPEMLRRAFGRYKYPFSLYDLNFSDAPEDQEREKMILGDLYIPKTGWARARYYKNLKDGEKFYYKPDPDKVDIVEVVIKPPPGERYIGEPQADLLLACKLGDLQKAAELIDNGAKVNYSDEHGDAALLNAAKHKRPEIVKLLLTHGADIDAKNAYGETALCLALSNRSRDIVFMLLDHGADVHLGLRYGTTPLHLAAHKGDLEEVEALLAKGADPNAIGENGNTPLFNAIWSRKVAIVQELSHGASTTVKNSLGQTPEDEARVMGDQAIIQLLRRQQ